MRDNILSEITHAATPNDRRWGLVDRLRYGSEFACTTYRSC
jgi:hypothetical protein